MNLYFNDLSLKPVILDRENGLKVFRDFIKLYSKAVSSEFGFSRSIKTHYNLNNIEISSGYYSAQWRNDKYEDKDLQRRYKRMCDLQLFNNAVDEDYEMYFDDKVCHCMLAAHQNDSFLISLKTGAVWESDSLNCKLFDLENDNTIDIKINNLFSLENIKNFIDEIKRKVELDNKCQTTEELFSKYEELFPSLCFCETACHQMQNDMENIHVPIITRKLLLLENYFNSWDGKRFDINSFPPKSVSPESKETINRFKKHYSFTYSGCKYTVSHHMRYTGNIPGRIYFCFNQQTRKAIIYSLTTKLPTVSYPKERI